MNKLAATQRNLMYRAMREAHPEYFGDPLRYYDSGGFSGIAYGEYEKGGGFIGAIVSVGAAVVTGGASLGFTTLASTLTTVSLVATTVGALTGNKTLASIGMLAGLGGTFLNLSSSGTFGDGLKGWASEAESSFSSMTGQTTTAQAVSDAASSGTNTVTTPDMPAQTDPTGTVASATNNVETAAGSLNLTEAASPATAAPSVSATDSTGLISSGTEGAGSASTLAGEGGGLISQPDLISSGTGGSGTSFATGATDANASIFDKLANYSNKYGKLFELGGQGVKFVGDLLKPDDSADRSKLMQSQAALYDTRAATEAAQLANMASVPDITNKFRINTSVTPNNATPVVAAGVRPAGLIQTRRLT